LLSERSARRTFPNLSDFSLVAIPGACRVFGHAAPVFFERGMASAGPPFEFASLCAEPWSSLHERGALKCGSEPDFALSTEHGAAAMREGRYIAATAFFVPPESMKEFEEREPEFSYVRVQPYTMTGFAPSGIPAVMCGRGSDDTVRSRLEQSDGSVSWTTMVSRHGIDTIWHHPPDKIFPCPPYLRHCVLASEILGVKNNFLDTTFLADRRTTIRQHLDRNPALLDTLPSQEAAKFYTP
jgi:hypothetical protein